MIISQIIGKSPFISRCSTSACLAIRVGYAEMAEWRQRNPGEIKLPDHKHVPAQPTAGQ